MNRMNVWGAGNRPRSIYLYKDKEHKHRMGNCAWLPKDGDLCVCVKASGDCFDDYVAMRIQKNGRYKMVGEFGAYAFGEPCGDLPNREFHLLQAGEEIIA